VNVPESGRITTLVHGRRWTLSRPADLENLWAQLGEDAPGAKWADDERLPYWVELWPAAVLLARFIEERADEVRGRFCLDAGCGLGLSALVAAACGGRVLAFDYEPEALGYARRNAGLNGLAECARPLWTAMDWRSPALAPGRADLLFGADILYERRFFEPVAALLDHALAPEGRAWIADPERSVSAGVWARLEGLGWRVATPCTARVAQDGQNMTVHIREISRKP
jgi:predicted nicotinamide N-methyase